MKKIIGILLLLTVAVTVCGCAAQRAQKEARLEQKRYEIIAAVENKDYSVSITRGHAISGSTMHSLYEIKVKDDLVDVHLPYVGQAYNLTFNDRGFNFKTEIVDYSWAVSNSESILISFKAFDLDDMYRVAMEIFLNGTVYATVSPINKQPMSYQGELVYDL